MREQVTGDRPCDPVSAGVTPPPTRYFTIASLYVITNTLLAIVKNNYDIFRVI